jgi:hypothetical protein
MLEVERNSPVDAALLAEFFARCGWREEEGSVKLEWALAAATEWVVCRFEGQMVGFGRACRFGPVKRVVFDVLVDPRFRMGGLRGEIVRLLAQNAGSLEEVSVFTEHRNGAFEAAGAAGSPPARVYLPAAPPGTYLGRDIKGRGGSE